MKKNLFPELIEDCLKSSLFGKDKNFTRLSKDLVSCFIKTAQAIYSTPDAIAILKQAYALSGSQVEQWAFTMLFNAMGGVDIQPFNEKQFNDIISAINLSAKDDFGDKGYDSYIVNIVKAIRTLARANPIIPLTEEHIKLLSTKIIEDVHLAADTEEEFQKNYVDGVAKLWDGFSSAVLASYKLYEPIEKDKKNQLLQNVLNAFLNTNCSDLIKLDAEKLREYFTVRAFNKGATSSLGLRVTAQTISNEELSAIASQYYYAALLRSAWAEIAPLLMAIPSLIKAKDTIAGYDYKRIFKRFSKTKTIKTDFKKLIDDLNSVTKDTLLGHIKAAKTQLKTSNPDVPLTYEQMSKVAEESVDKIIPSLLNQPWAAANRTTLEGICKNLKGEMSKWVQEFYYALSSKKAEFAAFISQTPEKFTSDINTFFKYVFILWFFSKAMDKKAPQIKADTSISALIQEAQTVLTSNFSFANNFHFVRSVLKGLGLGGGYWNREQFFQLFTALKEAIVQKINASAAQYDPTLKSRFSTVASNIEDPAVVNQYMGNQTVSTGHHMQAIFLFDRLRRVQITIPQAVDYLVGNIEQWGKTKTSGESQDELVPQFPPQQKLSEPIPPPGSGSSSSDKPEAEKQPDKIQMPADYNWVNRDVIGLASAVLYGIFREVHVGNSGF